jgi:hypothetical protein
MQIEMLFLVSTVPSFFVKSDFSLKVPVLDVDVDVDLWHISL